MEDFGEILNDYSDNLSSFKVGSFNRYGNFQSLEFKTFLRKVLEYFLKVPELYNKESGGIVFSPILPKFYISILMNFLIHSAFLGEPAPFKLDKKYFLASLKLKESELSTVFKDNSYSFNVNYHKISMALGTKYWHNFSSSCSLNSQHMFSIFKNYESIQKVRFRKDQNIASLISDEAADWLKRSFHDNSVAIRTSIYRRFKMSHFTSLEVYYILFEK